MLTKELQEALEADAEKLRQLTGEDHQVWFLHDEPEAPNRLHGAYLKPDGDCV